MMVRSEKLAVLGELAAGVAHEIRNPLTVVKGFMDLMNLDHSASNNQKFIPIIQVELEQMEHFINEMLFLAKPMNKSKKLIEICSVLESTI